MDELDSRMQRVLDAAREGMTPSAADTERTRRMLLAATAGLAVGVGAGTAAAATAAPAGAAATAAGSGAAAGTGVATASKGAGLFAAISSLSLGTKVVTAVAVSATIGTAGLLATQAPTTPAKQIAPIAAPISAQPIAAPIAAPTPTPQPEIAAQPEPEPAPPQTVTHKPFAPNTEKHEVATPDPLSAELALIERARQGLKSDNPQQALAALNEHGARFPNGVMAQERRALHALALCSLGDARGNQEAQRFLAQNPGSPLASHLRAGCK
jgi:hypothetical protein